MYFYMLIYLIVNQNTITKSQHAQFMLNTSTPKNGRYNKKETKQMMAHLNLDGMGHILFTSRWVIHLRFDFGVVEG